MKLSFCCLWTPENEGIISHLHPLWARRKGKGEAATSDFVFFVGDPRERRIYVVFSPSL